MLFWSRFTALVIDALKQVVKVKYPLKPDILIVFVVYLGVETNLHKISNRNLYLDTLTKAPNSVISSDADGFSALFSFEKNEEHFSVIVLVLVWGVRRFNLLDHKVDENVDWNLFFTKSFMLFLQLLLTNEFFRKFHNRGWYSLQ